MNASPPPIPWTRLGLWATLALAGTFLLQHGALAEAVRPSLRGPWREAALALALGLTVLAVLDRARGRSQGAVLALAALALLGHGAASFVPALHQAAAEARRTPPLGELRFLLSEVAATQAPVLLWLCALPVPLLAEACREGRRPARIAALSALGFALAGMALLICRVEALDEALQQLRSSPQIPRLERSGAWAASRALVAVTALLAGAALAWERRWLTASAWIPLVGLACEPLPGLLHSTFYAGGAGLGSTLPSCAGTTPGSSAPLLDLTGPEPRYRGEPFSGALRSRLLADGYADMGSDFLVQVFPPASWDWTLHRPVRLLPPTAARAIDLTPVLVVLARMGVSVWLWPGRAGGPAGLLAPAFEEPVLPLLLYEPQGDAPTCGVLVVSPNQAELRMGASSEGSLFALPRELELLARRLARCEAPLTVAPAPDLPLAALFPTLDRIGGSHPEATLYRRLALRWPALLELEGRERAP